jgi:FMN-dependent NADH-azoreductase
MSTLLYIEVSPRKERSSSTTVAEAFLDAYQANHPEDTIDRLDLWAVDLPPFNGETINAKYAILHGQPHTDAQKEAWRTVEQIIERFKAADKYVISLPMWNFGIPYRLKHYIDIITQPGYTFSFSEEEGYSGLVIGKPVATIYARGGVYEPGTDAAAIDFQKPYLEHALGFMGLTDLRPILIEGTMMTGPDELKVNVEKAIDQARVIARDF